MKEWLIEFRYESSEGQRLTSRIYANSRKEAEDHIKRKKEDESKPRVISYRLYELKEEEIIYEG